MNFLTPTKLKKKNIFMEFGLKKANLAILAWITRLEQG